jgi:hypothetical protein
MSRKFLLLTAALFAAFSLFATAAVAAQPPQMRVVYGFDC